MVPSHVHNGQRVSIVGWSARLVVQTVTGDYWRVCSDDGATALDLEMVPGATASQVRCAMHRLPQVISTLAPSLRRDDAEVIDMEAERTAENAMRVRRIAEIRAELSEIQPDQEA